MSSRSKRIAFASLMGIAGACTTETTTTPVYYYDAYGYPVVDYGYVDSMLWYDGYYDPYLGYATLTSASSGAALVEQTPDAGHAAAFPRPLLGLFAAWRVVLQHDCVTITDWTDSDEDGVPASYDTHFNCVNQTVGDRTSSVTGMVSIADADDNSKLSGFTATFTDFTVITTYAGTTRTRTLNGTASLMPGDPGMFQSNTNLTIAFDMADAGRTAIQGTYTAMGQATYTADSMSDLFAGGSVNLSGTGTLDRMFGNASQSRTITRQTPSPLHWNRNCRMQNPDSSGFDSGMLVFQDDKGGKLQVQFNGCATAAISATGG